MTRRQRRPTRSRPKAELAADPGAGERRRRAAQVARPASATRVAAALAALPEVEARKRRNGSRARRVSTTDPQAHVMKMGAGSARPTTCSSHRQVGRRLEPMVQVAHRCLPQAYLVDGGFVALDRFERLESPRASGVALRRRGWTRRRQGRPSTIECVNAHARRRGLTRRVQGAARPPPSGMGNRPTRQPAPDQPDTTHTHRTRPHRQASAQSRKADGFTGSERSLPKVPTTLLGRWKGRRRESPALLADESINPAVGTGIEVRRRAFAEAFGEGPEP